MDLLMAYEIPRLMASEALYQACHVLAERLVSVWASWVLAMS